MSDFKNKATELIRVENKQRNKRASAIGLAKFLSVFLIGFSICFLIVAIDQNSDYKYTALFGIAFGTIMRIYYN